MQVRERIADTAQRLRMKKWHLAQRRLSISMSSWCMSRNRVMFSSGFDESLSRILRSSSFWRDTYWWGIQSKMGNWKRTSKVSDFLAVCQFPLIQSSDSNSWDLREFGSSIEEHLGIEWKLVCLHHVKSCTEIDIHNTGILPRGSEIGINKIRHRVVSGWLQGRSPPRLVRSQVCDQVVFLDRRENRRWAVIEVWNQTINNKLWQPTSQSGDFRKIATQIRMMKVFCLVVGWGSFWKNFFRLRSCENCHLSQVWPFHPYSCYHH